MKLIFLLCLPVFFLISCSASDTETKIKPQGKYKYVVKDSVGNKIIEGIFSFSKPDKSTGLMTCYNEVTNIYDNDSYIAQRFNFASLNAYYDKNSKKIALDLNPNIQDNNIYVTIDISAAKLSASWIHSTMTGINNQGKIEVNKISN